MEPSRDVKHNPNLHIPLVVDDHVPQSDPGTSAPSRIPNPAPPMLHNPGPFVAPIPFIHPMRPPILNNADVYRQDPRDYEMVLLIQNLLKSYISHMQTRPALYNPMVNMCFRSFPAENLCRSSLRTFARYNRCVLYVKCAPVLFSLLSFLSLASKSWVHPRNGDLNVIFI